MDLLLCVAEENRMHPETYQTSTSGNVQYRLYQDVEENTYFAYDFSLYEEYHYNLARQKSYLYIYHTYFSQQGLAVSLSTGLFDTHRGDLCCWIDMNDQRNQYTDHYGLWCPYLLQTSRMFYIPESKIRIDLLEHEVDPYIDGYQIYFEIKQGTYDHQTVIHPFFRMTMPQYMDYDPMDIADQVTFYPIFKQ